MESLDSVSLFCYCLIGFLSSIAVFDFVYRIMNKRAEKGETCRCGVSDSCKKHPKKTKTSNETARIAKHQKPKVIFDPRFAPVRLSKNQKKVTHISWKGNTVTSKVADTKVSGRIIKIRRGKQTFTRYLDLRIAA